MAGILLTENRKSQAPQKPTSIVSLHDHGCTIMLSYICLYDSEGLTGEVCLM